MSALIGGLLGLGTVLFAAAIISRLAGDKYVPKIIDDAFTAMTNIFTGVFHG